jgi:hypothetical protein
MSFTTNRDDDDRAANPNASSDPGEVHGTLTAGLTESELPELVGWQSDFQYRPLRSDSEAGRGAMQYHQVRILCALRDKILEEILKADKTLTHQEWSSDYALIRAQAMDRARERMTSLGSGSRELFDLEGRDG